MKDKQNAWRQEKRLAIEKFFEPPNLIAGTHIEDHSPSGKFVLAVDAYSTGPRTWKYSRGIVTRTRDGQILADVKRNHSHFWRAWVQQDPDKEYLLCGEDYQGYSVLDLETPILKTHLPDAAQNGGGFCWIAVYPSKDGKLLAVEGCVWAAPYDLVFYDFSEPLNLPLPEIGRVNEIGKVIGWESENIFVVEHEFVMRKSDGRRFESLPDSEQEEYYRNESSFSYQTEVLHWNRLTRALVK